MGAGGFQNIFCLVDEKENLIAQKFLFDTSHTDPKLQFCH
jgi:hypothetical protein